MKEALHSLIHSLSQSEKRYFKLHSSFIYDHSNKSYSKLFKSLVRMDDYDERKAKESHTRFYAQKKKHLTDKILESLRAYHQKDTAESRIRNCLADFYNLIEKKFYRMAEKSLRRAEKLASAHERYADLLNIRQAQTVLLAAYGNPVRSQQHLQSLRKELPLILRKVDNQLEFEQYYLRFVLINREKEFVRSRNEQQLLDETFNKRRLADEKNAFSVGSKLRFHYVRGLYHFLSGNLGMSLMEFEKQITLYRNYTHLKEEQPLEHARALANGVLLSIYMGEQKKYEELYDELQHTQTSSVMVQEHIRYWLYVLQLKKWATDGAYEQAVDWIGKKQKHIAETEARLDSQNLLPTERSYVVFDTAFAYLGTGNLKKAKQAIHTYLNNTLPTVKTDAYTLARVLSLLIQTEIETNEQVEYELRSLRRFLKSRGRLFGFERESIKAIHELNAAPDPASKKKAWMKYHHYLQKFQDVRYERNVYYIFDIRKLAARRISNDSKA